MYESANENGNKVSIDMREDDVKESLSPTEMLLAAVSGCVAVDIVLILKKKKKQIDDFRIETTGKRREEHPRGFTHIHSHYVITSPDISEQELDKVSKLALEKYCSVAESIKSQIDYSVDVIRPSESPSS